jgi:hypothetical protein
MNQAISRCVRMDNWIFEVKMVRALKVDSYGKPYKAIAHFNINGDHAFLDGALSASGEQFSEQDIQTFMAMCQALEVKALKIGSDICSVKLPKILSLSPENNDKNVHKASIRKIA